MKLVNLSINQQNSLSLKTEYKWIEENEQSLWDLWDSSKRSNIGIIRFSEGEENKCEAEKYSKN